MDTLDFTKDEKEYIKETLQFILNDISKIYDLSDLENIFLQFTPGDRGNYLLCVGPKHIAILSLEKTTSTEWMMLFEKGTVNFEYPGNILLGEKKESFFKRENNQYISNSVATNEKAEDVAKFLVRYEDIRKDLIEYIKKNHKNKTDLFNQLRQLRTIYSSEVTVDLGQLSTINMQTIEVEEQDGKKIGTINFGNRLVKIITEGDIVLTKIEPVKEKIKEKR